MLELAVKPLTVAVPHAQEAPPSLVTIWKVPPLAIPVVIVKVTVPVG